MDVKFVNPVLESIVNVLSTMANLTPEAGKPSIKVGEDARGVVTGMIDFSGSKAKVSTAISLSRPVAIEITKRMLREEPEDINDMVEDLVGEIANMMAGGAKAKLEEQGYDFELTLPSVISGEQHVVKHTVDAPIILLPFSSDAGDFFVEICSR